MGVTPYTGELPEGVSGMIVKEHSSEPRAYTERTEPQTRRRFTLAHELGHFVERVTIAQDNDFAFMDKRSDDYDIHEFYADEFAGALLMPEHDFIQKVKERWDDRGRSIFRRLAGRGSKTHGTVAQARGRHLTWRIMTTPVSTLWNRRTRT